MMLLIHIDIVALTLSACLYDPSMNLEPHERWITTIFHTGEALWFYICLHESQPKRSQPIKCPRTSPFLSGSVLGTAL